MIGRRRREPVPVEPVTDVLARTVVEWPVLSAAERDRLVDDTTALLETKHWEAARGFELTHEMRVVIAGHAALVTLALGIEEYRHVRAVVVHPRPIVSTVPRPGPVPGTMQDGPIELLGEAHDRRGPIVLAWDAVRRDIRHGARTGRNVVIHEFVHKLDMLDGVIDGTPPLSDGMAVAEWAAISEAEFRSLRSAGDELLSDYGATDRGEFFAVAAELFFTRPAAMAAAKPRLYAVYRDYFGQDPAARRITG